MYRHGGHKQRQVFLAKAEIKIAHAGFEIRADHIDTVFKLSQNRDELSYNNIIAELEAKAGNIKNALATARSIDDQREQSAAMAALQTVAIKQAKAGDTLNLPSGPAKITKVAGNQVTYQPDPKDAYEDKSPDQLASADTKLQ